MSHQDRNLTCIDCAGSFAFSAEEQELGVELGFDDPKRCSVCRRSLDDRRRSVDDRYHLRHPFGLLPLTALVPARSQLN